MASARIALIGIEFPNLEELLQDEGYELRHVSPAEAALEIDATNAEIALIDLLHDRQARLELLQQLRHRAKGVAIVALTGVETDDIVEVVRAGADHFVTQRFEDADFLPVLKRALEKSRASKDALAYRRFANDTLSFSQFPDIVGNHPSMQQLLSKVAHVATTRASVLIHGESGTGKELIAAAIHHNSKRKSGPFVRLNCAALAESLLESELFGHEKGAFTGAATRRDGRFKQADGGTLFLDEVSEIPMALQVKLLRFLQEREFERVGGNDTLRVDVRIVAATNRDLKKRVDEELFREDLFYRLNVVRLEVPPLRARPSDILALAEHFLRKHAEENEREVVGFSDEARQILLDYPWPGNVRELENTIEQAVVLAEGKLVTADELPLTPPRQEENPVRLMIPGITMAELERYAVLQTLQACGGSTAKAAQILDVSRRTIQYRLKEWGVTDKLAGYRPETGGRAVRSVTLEDED